jgi:hypothetical protein
VSPSPSSCITPTSVSASYRASIVLVITISSKHGIPLLGASLGNVPP